MAPCPSRQFATVSRSAPRRLQPVELGHNCGIAGQFTARLLSGKHLAKHVELASHLERRGFGKTVGKEATIEVVKLMLHDAGHEAIEIQAYWLAVERPGVNDDLRGPPHVHPYTRQAQATFFLNSGAARPAQYWIDKDMLFPVAASPGTVHDKKPVWQRHLIRSEANAFGLIHDLEHLLDRVGDRVVKPSERLGWSKQRRMRILDEVERPDGMSVWRGWCVGHRDGKQACGAGCGKNPMIAEPLTAEGGCYI